MNNFTDKKDMDVGLHKLERIQSRFVHEESGCRRHSRAEKTHLSARVRPPPLAPPTNAWYQLHLLIYPAHECVNRSSKITTSNKTLHTCSYPTFTVVNCYAPMLTRYAPMLTRYAPMLTRYAPLLTRDICVRRQPVEEADVFFITSL